MVTDSKRTSCPSHQVKKKILKMLERSSQSPKKTTRQGARESGHVRKLQRQPLSLSAFICGSHITDKK